MNMEDRLVKSNSLWKKALKAIPMGTQNFSKAPNQFAEGINPKYLEKGKGCYVWDVDGKMYLDYLVGLGPIVLGYADDDVNRAAREQLDKGTLFGLPSVPSN